MSTSHYTVYIVDDDATVRVALARLVESAAYRVSTFGSAQELLEELGSLGPGCLVLDVRLPDLDGLELFRQLQLSGSFMPVIFMTGYGDIPMSVRAIKAGAFDFLTKPIEDTVLLRAIDGAFEEIARTEAERIASDELSRRYESLTPRETQVMELVLAGRLNKQIARDLGISEKTVKVHRARVMSKMGARRVAHLVHYAMRIGAIRIPSGSRAAVSSVHEAEAMPVHAAPARPGHAVSEPAPAADRQVLD